MRKLRVADGCSGRGIIATTRLPETALEKPRFAARFETPARPRTGIAVKRAESMVSFGKPLRRRICRRCGNNQQRAAKGRNVAPCVQGMAPPDVGLMTVQPMSSATAALELRRMRRFLQCMRASASRRRQFETV
jgi:hypothetical protein